MIEITATNAFMIYLGTTLFILFSVWVYSHYRSRGKVILSPEKQLYVCEFCQFAYLDSQAKTVTKCPQCHSYNKNNPYTLP